jgi:uncharacterized PurR-regulated membrane protein YhhQ (DUF165 family)
MLTLLLSPFLLHVQALAVWVLALAAPVTLTDTQAWGLILGLASPLAIAVIQRPYWSAAQRALIAAGFAVAVGLLTVLSTSSFDLKNLLATIALVLVASHTAYESFFKPTKIASKVENATSGSAAPAPSSGGKHIKQE